jgi:methionyl aminopeptidase
MSSLKSDADLELYREAGRIAAEVLTLLKDEVRPGINTYDIAKIAEDLIVRRFDAIPSSIGQYGFQFALNSSVNHVVCHGVPSRDEILRDGDIVNLDVTVKKHGWIADTSRMYFVGSPTEDAKRLCQVAYECLYKGIAKVKPGGTVGDIGHAIHKHATRNGFSVVREYCGHGIGRKMHEEPEIAHYGKPGRGVVLQKGMTFTIEPMINQGSPEIEHLSDDWTVVTKDQKLSAQWEHTVAVTDHGCEILTLREEERSSVGSAS